MGRIVKDRKNHHINKKITSIFFIIGFSFLTISGGILIYLTHLPLDNVKITVDFADFYTSSTYPYSESQQVVIPVYNTLNIWDIDWFFNPYFTPAEYRTKYYWVDQLVVMTATGGRDTFSNEYMNITESGTVEYNFTKLEKMIDWLKAANINPIFVIGNTPHNLTEDLENMDYGAFGANTAEPNNYTKYYDYIQALVQHVLNYGGSDFINNWTWRIYTEPDNKDWLKDTLDAYFRIYNVSALAIRSILPNAKLELGNMMDKKLDDRFKSFINKLHAEIPDLFPNVIGWSLYGFASEDLYMKEGFRDIETWKRYIFDLGYTNVEFVIEEGQILADENGKRLWSGDSTELGGVFTANAYKTCIVNNISRYTTWEFYSCEIRTPKLNVLDMFRLINGERLVKMQITYESLTQNYKKTIDGIASISNGNDKCHLLLYNLIHDRDYRHNVTIQIEFLNLPHSFDQVTQFVVNKKYSNFHVDWDVFSKAYTYYSNPAYNDGSRYDVAIGSLLRGEEQTNYYLWSWDHRLDYQLHSFTEPFNPDLNQVFEIELDSNEVRLIEFNL